jgi:photosystem II stability/assembly factor-like uncharacterized protein
MLSAAILLGGPVAAAPETPGLTWRFAGPERGGRVTAVVGIPGQIGVYFAGTVGGGVWRTDSAGAAWSPLATKTFGSGSVGALAIDPTRPDVIYAGMGESVARPYMSSMGDGLYKSIDGGKTWAHLGFTETRRIGGIVIDPKSPDTLYIAALGNAWSPSQHRGVFKSLDAGKTWTRVHFVNETTSAADLVMDPTDSQTLYVTMWDNLRTPWRLGSGGPGGGVFKTTDGGRTWRKLSGGLPAEVGKIGISVSPVDPNRLYAVVESTDEAGGVFVSDNAGETWRRVNASRQLRTRPWYYMHITADPKVRDRVYVNNLGFWRSDDGGVTFTQIPTPHGDNHDVWIDPGDNRVMVQGNDGGVNVTLDGGKAWSSIYNQASGQFYRVAVDKSFPYAILGAQQDNTTLAIRSREDLGGRSGADIYEVGGGEAGFVVADPFDNDIIYAGSEMGFLTRMDRRTGLATFISGQPRFPEGVNPVGLRYRFNVNAPLVASIHTEGVIYHAAHVVLKSTDRGFSWREISPDLTRDEPAKQQEGGGPFTNERIDAHNALAYLDESPLDGRILWAGSDDGLIHLTTDGGGTWRNVTPTGIGEGEVNTIAASPLDKATAYAAVTLHRFGDMRPHLFRTQDSGATWTAIGTGLPQATYARAVEADPVRKGLIYAGTEQGLYVSFDDGATWRELSDSLPTTPVTGIAVKDDDLVISTEGRGFWIYSGLSTLRQLEADLPASRLFAPPPAYVVDGEPMLAGPVRTRDNPPQSYVDVFLSADDLAAGRMVRVEVVGPDGAVVRQLGRIESGRRQPLGPPRLDPFLKLQAEEPGPVITPGVHRFTWDLRGETAVAMLGVRDGRIAGPRSAPGRYLVRLITAQGVQEQPLNLLPPPDRAGPSVPALEEKRRLLDDTRGLFLEIGRAVSEAETRATKRPQGSRAHRAWVQWEAEILSRKLEAGGVDRVNYSGGLMFDVATLYDLADSSATPLGPAYRVQLDELKARWASLKAAAPR